MCGVCECGWACELLLVMGSGGAVGLWSRELLVESRFFFEESMMLRSFWAFAQSAKPWFTERKG